MTPSQSEAISGCCRGLDVAAGDLIELSLEADGDPPISYAWTRDGQPLQDQTSPVLVVLQAANSDSGQYHCKASNSAGTASSLPAFVVVREATLPLRILQQPRSALQQNPDTRQAGWARIIP